MVGKQEPAQRGHGRDCNGDETHRPHPVRPEPGCGGGKHHQANGEERAERLEPSDEIEHDKRQEQEMRRRADAADRPKEERIEALRHERAPEDGERQEGDSGDAHDQDQGLVVERQDGAEQHMHQVDARSAPRHHQHADGKRDQVEGRHRGVFLLNGQARHDPRSERHQKPDDKPADGHRDDLQTEEKETDGGAGKDRMGHGVAGQAHAAQHQKDADRRAAGRQEQRAEQGALHEAVADEGSIRYSYM